MKWGPLLLCGWPGLARLWYRGHWSSLGVAIAFSVLLNVALVTSFVWPWSLGGTFPVVAWPTIFLVWLVSATVTYRNLPALMTVTGPATTNEPADALFNQAQREYLKGDWLTVESILRRCLEKSERDVEARLLLATAYRHQRKLDEARHELRTMQRLDESARWDFEIRREQSLVNLIEQQDHPPNESSNHQSQSSPAGDNLTNNAA